MKIIRFLPALVLVASLPLTSRGAEDTKPPVSAHGPKPALSGTVKNVGVEEFAKLRAQTNTVVLDVRTAKEFSAGHIPGAVNLDVNGPDFQKKVAELDKSKIYLVHCAAGVRSAQACVKMDKLSFTNLVNLDSGLKGWEKAGQPVEK